MEEINDQLKDFKFDASSLAGAQTNLLVPPTEYDVQNVLDKSRIALGKYYKPDLQVDKTKIRDETRALHGESPIHHLPPELMEQIFVYACKPNVATLLPERLGLDTPASALGLVCSYWHTLVHDHPSPALWDSIQFEIYDDYDLGDRKNARFKAWMSFVLGHIGQSGQWRAHFSILPMNSSDWAWLDLLAEYLPSCRTIQSPASLFSVSSPISPDQHFQSLQSLSITNLAGSFRSKSTSPIGPQSQLRELYLHGFDAQQLPNLYLENLTSFICHRCSLGAILAVLRQSQNLVNFDTGTLMLSERETPLLESAIYLSSLSTLSFSFRLGAGTYEDLSASDDHTIWKLLDMLTLPQLNNLRILIRGSIYEGRKWSADHFTVLESLVTRSRCQIQSLTYESSLGTTTPAFLNFLTFCGPSLHTLQLNRSSTDALDTAVRLLHFLTPSPDNPAPLPHLVQLDLTATESDFPQFPALLLNMVQSRWYVDTEKKGAIARLVSVKVTIVEQFLRSKVWTSLWSMQLEGLRIGVQDKIGDVRARVVIGQQEMVSTQNLRRRDVTM